MYSAGWQCQYVPLLQVEAIFLIKLGLNGVAKRSEVRFVNNLKDLVENSH